MGLQPSGLGCDEEGENGEESTMYQQGLKMKLNEGLEGRRVGRR